ncbi:histidine kinase [Phytomonospora sp. NPDC050363]|uniref:sensor histidine kinase n=1 Tax=Phytomonospora sp. NPDC050363 TaxID=3155642 RepID=UPI0033C050D8
MTAPGTDDRAANGLGNLRRFTWLTLVASIVLTLIGVLGWRQFRDETPLWSGIVGIAALAVVSVACVVAFYHRLAFKRTTPPAEAAADRPPPAPVAWLVAGSVAAVVLAALILAIDPGDEAWCVAPASMVTVIAMFLRPVDRRVLIAGAVIAGTAVEMIPPVAAGDDRVLGVLLVPSIVIFTVWVVYGLLWAWDVAERLDTARGLAADLAVTRERLRFAADLHDIQGHHLQVIALKSELAARLASRDPDRAAAEMREVRELAADALRDTRAVVQGYRRTTLDAEIANAGRVLAAADIEVATRLDPVDELPEAARHLLGLVVREATTNVLRHSGARFAEVDFTVEDGRALLRVGNDGAHDSGGDGGTGLRGLAARLAEAGGELTWKREDDRFAVAASLPLDRGTG